MAFTKQMLQGFFKILKWKLSIDLEVPEVIERRVASCLLCSKREPFSEQAVDSLKLFTLRGHKKLMGLGKCNECGCFLTAKVSLIGQSCPIRKW